MKTGGPATEEVFFVDLGQTVTAQVHIDLFPAVGDLDGTYGPTITIKLPNDCVVEVTSSVEAIISHFFCFDLKHGGNILSLVDVKAEAAVLVHAVSGRVRARKLDKPLNTAVIIHFENAS